MSANFGPDSAGCHFAGVGLPRRPQRPARTSSRVHSITLARHHHLHHHLQAINGLSSSHSMVAQTRYVLALIAVWSALVSLAYAGQDFRGQIQPNAELGHVMNLGPNTKVLLRAIPSQESVETASPPSLEQPPAADDNQTDLAAFGHRRDRSTLVAVDGSFIFRNVEQGAYTLQVISRTHIFEKYRVDIVDPELGKAPQIRIFTPGTSLVSILSSNLVFHPLILHAVKRVDYYTEAAPLTLGSLIGMGGPMMILGLVAMGMVFILPKLTASLDPEAQKELADSQARMQKRLAAVQSGDVSSLLYKDDHVQKSQAREAAANNARAQRNTGPSK